MDFKELLKGAGKNFADKYLKGIKFKIKIAGAIAGVFLVLLVVLFAGADSSAEAEKDNYENGMNNAAGDSWEFFVENFVKKWEGHEGKDKTGTKYKIGSVLGNRTVGYGVDLETSGAEKKLKDLGYTDSQLQLGCYIDIDIVEQLMMDELKDRYDLLINSMNANNVQAKEYQVFAFVDFGYNDRRRDIAKILWRIGFWRCI